MSEQHRVETQVIHAGEIKPRPGGAAVLPIYQSAVYECRGGENYAAIPYPRLSNLPNHQALGDKIAVLEGAADAMVLASGMAAISTALLTVLRSGDHLLVQDCLYGGTQSFVVDDLAAFGISHDVIATDDPESWAAQVKPNTRAIYTEAITNPMIQVIDHAAVVAFAQQHDLVSLIDATFTTPINFRPLAVGYDVSLHSATKYLNGHSDLAAGAVAGRSQELMAKIRGRASHLGGSMDPHACFLLHRGLRTLALRVRAQNDNALAIARFLEGRDEVASVNYAGLESSPSHAIAREMFSGYGGMLSFELHGGSDAAEKLLDRVELAIPGPSLGGCESLLSVPAKLSHLGQTPSERARMGVTDGLVRMSVGIEAVDDLIADLTQALEGA